MTDVYFVTNRNPNRQRNPDDFGTSFSSTDAHDLRFGRASVVRRGGDLEVERVEVAPEKLSMDPRRVALGSNAMFLDLRESMKNGADTVAFVHGYNVSFKEALIAGGQIVEDYAPSHPLNVVVFSWPSDGSMVPLLAYKSDRADARASGPALARLLLRTRDFLGQIARGDECGGRLHLLAHSMGNYVLRNALEEIKRVSGDALPRIFDEIFLMAADEDHDAFEKEHKLLELPSLADSVNVYFNRGDTAMVIADRTKSNPARLGSRGPRMPLAVPGNVTLVDCSDVVSGLVEHTYFVEHDRVNEDVLAVLKGGSPEQIPKRRYVPSQNRYVLEK